MRNPVDITLSLINNNTYEEYYRSLPKSAIPCLNKRTTFARIVYILINGTVDKPLGVAAQKVVDNIDPDEFSLLVNRLNEECYQKYENLPYTGDHIKYLVNIYYTPNKLNYKIEIKI